MNIVRGLGLVGAFCLLLTGCAVSDESGASPNEKSSVLPVFTSTNGGLSTDQSDPTALVGWVGQYTYGEVIGTPAANMPPTATMGYAISVYQMGTGFFAALSLNGNNATQNIMASVQGDATTITLYFDSFTETNPWPDITYEPGDPLLTLTRQDAGIMTTWDKMHPQSTDNTPTPGSGFTSTTPSTETPTPTSTAS